MMMGVGQDEVTEDDTFFEMMMGMGSGKSKWSTEELALMPNVHGILKVQTPPSRQPVL